MQRTASRLVVGLLFVCAVEPARATREASAGSNSERADNYNVRGFGAKGDGTAVDSGAINKAIDAAAAAGGGIVDLPAGRYLSFSIRLKSHVTLRFSPGAVLIAGDPASGLGQYDLPEANAADRYQDFGHSHWRNSLISAIDVEDVAIVGPGLIDGRGLTRGGPGAPWSRGRAGDRPLSMGAAAGRASDPEAIALRRMDGQGNKAIALKRARNVTLRDFSILNGGHFALLATGVDTLTIDNLKVDTNRDGFDIDACRNVRISNSSVNSPNDDAIVIKSSYALGEARATENVTITNCLVSGYDAGSFLDGTYRTTQERAPDRDGVTGRIKLGTESNGGFRNITISNCVFDRSRGLALETVDGGALEDITVTNLTMRHVTTAPIFLRLGNRGRGPEGTPIGSIKRVLISHVVAYDIEPRFASIVAGLPGHPIEDVTLSDIRLVYRGGGTAEDAARQPPEVEEAYPEPSMFGTVPAFGFFVRHAQGISMRDIVVTTMTPDSRPPYVLHDVNGMLLDHAEATRGGTAPFAVLRDVSDLNVRKRPRSGGRPARARGGRHRAVSAAMRTRAVKPFLRTAILAGSCLLPSQVVRAQPVMENLGRGVVVVRSGETSAYIGWRLLGTDPAGVGFNLYRTAGSGGPIKLNKAVLTTTTDFVDATLDPALANRYTVRAVVRGRELDPSSPFVLPANTPIQQFLSVPLQRPPGGEGYTYNANDASAGDLDGDGEYEIVLKWDPSNARDTASRGVSGNVILDGYKLDGTRLWRIDLGRNVRAGAHYTQFIVYDLDGDGRAEVACKTADGTVDGLGKVVGDATKDYRSLVEPSDGVQVASAADARFGKVLAGPEYFTIFDGLTGAARATVPYVPGREPQDGWGGIGGNGGSDNNGNRVDRFLAGVAYLDGRLPSVLMARGYYGRTVIAAWDWRNGALTSRWVFDSGSAPPPYPNPAASPYSGQGNHSLAVADVDGDGRDEIVYGSMVVDDDGKGLFSTGLRHGDALHVSDLDPARPGLEVFGIHENEEATVALGTPGLALYDARTGAIIWSLLPGGDVGRGLAADIDPRYSGDEFWTSASVGLLDTHGRRISDAPRSVNFAVWWDADPLREILDGNWIAKWDPASASLVRLLTADGAAANNGSKATPALSGDILGDWREEVIWRSADNTSLRIYTTTIPAVNRLYTLMHDRTYRLAIAWQNVGYNQPPHPGFFIGDGMSAPPRPRILTPKR